MISYGGFAEKIHAAGAKLAVTLYRCCPPLPRGCQSLTVLVALAGMMTEQLLSPAGTLACSVALAPLMSGIVTVTRPVVAAGVSRG